MRNADRHSDSGFTLGEVLIATALTLVIVSAAVEMLTRTLTLTGTARVISETNHGLQAGTSLMVRDLMQTGQGVPLGGIPIPNGTGATAVKRPGLTGMVFPVTQTVLPALSPGNGLGPTLLGVPTDLINVVYADRTLNLSANPLTSIAADGSTMTVAAATPVTGVGGLQAGDVILFSNALGNALQMVTTTPTSQTVTFAAGDPMNLNQRGAAAGSVMNLQSSPGVFPPTTATRVLIVSYFVDTTTDPTLPRLVRRINMGQNLAIAMGVENLQVTYDLVDGVTNPTNVDTPAVTNSANQIRKANIFLSARSQDVNPQTKQFFRNTMATQVGLRSLSFVDRYR
jgi:hypothetical protein